jgi:hypothetical protein
MNAVLICDEFIVVVADVDQEEELLVVVGRQGLDMLFEVVQVLGLLLLNFTICNFFLVVF